MFLTNEQTLTPSFSVDMTVASKSKQNGTLQNILKPFKVVCYLQFSKNKICSNRPKLLLLVN